MLKSRTTAKGFDSDLKAILPRLRVYALALTHDRDRADDLVQQTAVKALVGRKSFRPGTNFGGWLFRIQRNEFISGLRRLRPTVCFDDISTNTLSHPPHQESGLVMREFMGAFRHLAPGTRQALLLVLPASCTASPAASTPRAECVMALDPDRSTDTRPRVPSPSE